MDTSFASLLQKIDASIRQLEAVLLSPNSIEQSTILFFSIHRQVLALMPSIFWMLKRVCPERTILLDSGQAYWKIAHRYVTDTEKWLASNAHVMRAKLNMEKMRIARYTMMWYAADYFSPPRDFWTSVYASYQHLDRDTHKNTTASRSSDLKPQENSLQNEFNSLVALSVCALDTMRSDEIFYASTILDKLARYLVLSTVRGAQDRFMLTLNEPSAPHPIPDSPTINTHVLFFCIPDFETHLAHVSTKPAMDMAMLQNRVFQTLKKKWASSIPNRHKYERQKTSIAIHIVIGLSPILATLSLSSQPFPAQLHTQEITLPPEATSTAQVTDTSIGGFGLQLRDFEATPVTFGSVVALRMPEATTWHIGLVKRIRRQNKTAFLGIQLLSSKPLVSHVQLADSKQEPIILLPDFGTDHSSGVILADRPAEHFTNSVITLLTDTHMRSMAPDVLCHSGPDYTLWEYKITDEPIRIQKDTVPDLRLSITQPPQ